jgi:acyl-CoA thioesterase I
MLEVVWRRRHFIAAVLAGSYPTVRAAAPRTILVVGDSISAEYGLVRGTGWVPLLQKRLAQQRMDARVVNASISGDTTSGGRSRLPALLAQHKPHVVVIELGGNDALRGLPLQMTQDNLVRMVEDAQKAGAKVLVVGIEMPANYGAEYASRFAAVFTNVGKARKVPVVRSIFAGLDEGGDTQRWFQPDRIHPTAQAQAKLLDNVWPELKKLLQ